METIRELLAGKGSDVWTIAPEKTIYDALVLMAFRFIATITRPHR